MKRTLPQKLGLLGVVSLLSYAAAEKGNGKEKN